MSSYAPEEVSTIIDGAPITGFAEDSSIEIDFNEDQVKLKIGQDGHDCTSLNPARFAGTITIKLLQDSPDLARLSALTEIPPGSFGPQKFPILVQDGDSETRAYGTFYVKKFPKAAFGREVGDRTFVFESANMRADLAGIFTP